MNRYPGEKKTVLRFVYCSFGTSLHGSFKRRLLYGIRVKGGYEKYFLALNILILYSKVWKTTILK
jgi:hypothetical protein